MHSVLYGLKWHLLFFACEVKQWVKKRKGWWETNYIEGCWQWKVIKKKLWWVQPTRMRSSWYLLGICSQPPPHIFFLSPSFPISNCVEVFTKGSLLSQKALNINTTIILYIIHYKLNVLVGLHNKIWWGGCLFKGDNRKKFDGEILLSEVVESER